MSPENRHGGPLIELLAVSIHIKLKFKMCMNRNKIVHKETSNRDLLHASVSEMSASLLRRQGAARSVRMLLPDVRICTHSRYFRIFVMNVASCCKFYISKLHVS